MQSCSSVAKEQRKFFPSGALGFCIAMDVLLMTSRCIGWSILLVGYLQPGYVLAREQKEVEAVRRGSGR